MLSGIEMACWDIVGKAVGKPVYELLGGRVHERLRAYTYLYTQEGDATDVYTDPALAAERAAEYVARGFTALKFDPAGPYSAFDPRQPDLEALERSRGVRRARSARRSAPAATCSSAPTASSRPRRDPPGPPARAVRPALARGARPARHARRRWQQVARATTIPIATGERLTTKYEFSRVLATGAAPILQPNLGRVGGLLEGKKIAALAEAHYAQIAPHLYCGPVIGAANIQLAACSPNFLLLEGILDWGGFHAEILRRPDRVGGRLRDPVRRSRVSASSSTRRSRPRIPTTGRELHLTPAEAPLGLP